MVYIICKLPSGFLCLSLSNINSMYAASNPTLAMIPKRSNTTTTRTVRLLSESEPDERIQRKARIADPARAVIPITRSPDVFGEGKRGAGDDGPRRLIDEQFEREGRAVDGFFPRPGVGRLRDPVVPVPVGDLCVREQKQSKWTGLDTHG